MTPKCCFLGLLLSVLQPGVVETQPANESLKPQRVHFQSRNFHNILHWQPGRACLGNNSIYFVQYKVYGERQWKNKENCWGIREFFCDLTNETSDIWEPYYGRVKTTLAGIHSGWTMTQRFTPWWEITLDNTRTSFPPCWLNGVKISQPSGGSLNFQFLETIVVITQKKERIKCMGSKPFDESFTVFKTKIDPPVMNITHINGSLLVNLHAPNLPYRDQKGENVSMEYYELVYRVFIINNSLEKEQKVYEGAHRVVEIKVTSPHTGYCVVAEIYQPMLDRKSQRSRERCVGSP